jgi:TfoX/Sxy family transcriptional regulator of competence genes
MVYSLSLVHRIRDALSDQRGISERKMFGGVAFMCDGNMCVGVWQDSLIARLGQDQSQLALKLPHVGEFDITGRPMKGWVLITPDGIDSETQLREWIERALEFVRELPPKHQKKG